MLDNPVIVNFDRYDGGVVTDPDGTIHLPVIVRGSTIKFDFRLLDEDTNGFIDPANYTIEAQWRKSKSADTVEASATATKVGNIISIRVPADTVQDMTSDVGYFSMKYTVNDGPADLHEHTFVVGQYHVQEGSLDL